MNIILMSSATSRARVLTLDWRHGTFGAFGLFTLIVGCALIFNFITLKYAVTSQNPLLQAILLADQRQEAIKTQEIVQSHLNTMAIRLGELQARVLRLDGLGAHLAKAAGLSPQELPSLKHG